MKNNFTMPTVILTFKIGKQSCAPTIILIQQLFNYLLMPLARIMHVSAGTRFVVVIQFKRLKRLIFCVHNNNINNHRLSRVFRRLILF